MLQRKDLVGVYRQLGDELVGPDGTLIHADRNRNSQIMYNADGFMGVVSTPAGRKKIEASSGRPDLGDASAEELVEATRTVTCYAGRFSVQGDEVHHHVVTALNPNLVDTTLVRRVQIDGPNLTLSAKPDAEGRTRRILWRRVEVP